MQDKFANLFWSIGVSFIIFWKFWNCILELSFLIFICIYVIIRELSKDFWEIIIYKGIWSVKVFTKKNKNLIV